MLEINQSLDCWLIGVKHQHRNALYIPKQAELWSEIQLETLANPYHFSSLEIAAIVNVYVRFSHLRLLILTVLLTLFSGSTKFCFFVLYSNIPTDFDQQACLTQTSSHSRPSSKTAHYTYAARRNTSHSATVPQPTSA